MIETFHVRPLFYVFIMMMLKIHSSSKHTLSFQDGLYFASTTTEDRPYDQRIKIDGKSQLCFGHKDVDTCSGDSGGPIVCKAPDEDHESEFYLAGNN